MMMTMTMTMMNTRPTISSSLFPFSKNPHLIKTTSTTTIRCCAISTQTDVSPNQVQKKEAVKEIPSATTTTTGRRGTVGIGLFLAAAAAATLFPQDSEAAASTVVVEYKVTPSGLGYYDKVVGIGPQPTKGQLIKAHYVGKLENGTVFDSSYNRGKPLSFRVGVGEVIKGWDQGILGGDGIPPMLPGGKRSLKLPSDLAYGMRGAGCKGGTNCIIPPNSTLLFDVEFIGKA